MLKPRAKTMGEYKEASNFIWAPRPIEMEDKAAKNVQSDQQKQTMNDVIELLNGYLFYGFSKKLVYLCIHYIVYMFQYN